MKRDNTNKILQDIWQTHIDVQEQMLKLRSVPVSVIPDSAKIVGDKLYLKIDENDKTDTFLDSLASTFDIDLERIDLNQGYIHVEKSKSKKVRQSQREGLSQKAAANFIEFLQYPIIDGYVNKHKSPICDLKDVMDSLEFDYDFDRNGRLQISITDLNRLNNDSYKNIAIPDKASLIIQVEPNPAYFLKKRFPHLPITHKIRHSTSKREQEFYWQRTLEVSGGRLNEAFAKRLNKDFGLTLIGYDYTFYVDSKAVKKYNPKESSCILPNFNKDNNSFLFHTNLLAQHPSSTMTAYNDEKWEFDIKFKRLKKFFDNYFGAENVRFESKFIYSYDLYKYTTEFLPSLTYKPEDFWQELYNTINTESVSISKNTRSIGIDFNWRESSIEDILEEVINACPFFNFRLFRNHRCNIEFQIMDVSLDEIENQLREKFPSIKLQRNNRKGTLYFYQQYQSDEQAIMLKEMIKSELENFDGKLYQSSLYEVPAKMEKYILSADEAAKSESISTAIKEIRGADFNFNGNYLGKLIKVNFPLIILDISGDLFEENKNLIDKNRIASIEPNLTGDIEKINRLKLSLTNILSGKNLQNPKLSDFIFDASKAKPIDDLDYHIDATSDTYRDFENHLLNKRINHSQKQTIIKTMLSEDLALIQGPPGTGKSTAIAEIIWQHIRTSPDERILLTSETNLAVDNAIDRIVNDSHNLVKPIRIGSEDKLEAEGRQFSLDAMKRWVETGVINPDVEEDSTSSDYLSQQIILINWINNVKNRVDDTTLDEDTFKLWGKVLSDPTYSTRKIFYDAYIANCNVIGATCSSIGKNNTKGRPTSFYKSFSEIFGSVQNHTNREGKAYSTYQGHLKFTTVIQDESSKATPAELSLPLIYGTKNIIIGDHRQLPPLLDKESFAMSLDFLLDKLEDETEIRKVKRIKSFIVRNFEALEVSHFERLYNQIDSSLKGIFNLQYRMHPDINEVIEQFYASEGGLQCGLITPTDLGVNDPDMSNPASRYHGINIDNFIGQTPLSANNHVVWIDTDSPELLDGTSRVNYGEVEAIQEILEHFRQSDSFQQYQNFWDSQEDQQIGLISFYGKQIRLLQDLSSKYSDIPIRVSTVDRFQGMERNIIIVSMVRSNRIASDKYQKHDSKLYGDLGFPIQKELGFARSPNRLNVALSRAKRLLIIVGNSELFRQKKIYENVYQTIANNPNGKVIKYSMP